MKKSVLIVGNGGREHALAWKIAQSPHVEKVFVAPGNGGTAHEQKVTNIDIASTDTNALADFAKKNNIDMTIIGSENPLEAGIVDLFRENNLRCFGPTQQAAQLESSRKFSKRFMQEHKVPTATYQFFMHYQDALDYLQNCTYPQVIKTNGLAAGKGVTIVHNKEEAKHTLDTLFIEKKFGDAGCSVVIEEFLEGQELSFIIASDGTHILPLEFSQDHKDLYDNNQGPKTGGMGALSPTAFATPQLYTTLINSIVKPTFEGLKKERIVYTGFLYIGIMLTENGPKVLEYNCRLGDPETQPLMMRLESDLYELCDAGLNGTLDTYTLQWSAKPAVSVVLASKGYPLAYEKGKEISDATSQSDDSLKVFHAGTQVKNTKLYTNGGRVMAVTTLGDTLEDARAKAYKALKKIYWQGVYYRTDIGKTDTKTYTSSYNFKSEQHA